MTTENTVVEDVSAAEAMQAGFNNVSGDTHEESRPAKVEPKTPAPEVTPEPTPEPETVSIKADEWQATQKQLADLVDQQKKAFGHIGQMKNVVEELKRGTAPGQPAKVSADQFKRLKAEYGDEMASALAEDLSQLTLSGGSVDHSAIEKSLTEKFEAKLEARRQEQEMRLVRRAHSDFDQIRVSDEFKTWRASLPTEAQTALAEASKAYDSELMVDALTDFKEWREKNKKPQTTNTRLESSVQPKGTKARGTPSVLPDSAGLSIGFQKVHGAGP